MNFKEKFTIREWSSTTGEYEWDLPENNEWAKCLISTAKPFDDGRYRQVSYEVIKPDCKDVLVRTSTAKPAEGEAPKTQAYSFTVWFEGEPAHDGMLVPLTVDAEGKLPPFEINSGAFFTTRTSEKEHFPKGFPWVEPTPDTVFKCVDVKNMNLGNL